MLNHGFSKGDIKDDVIKGLYNSRAPEYQRKLTWYFRGNGNTSLSQVYLALGRHPALYPNPNPHPPGISRLNHKHMRGLIIDTCAQTQAQAGCADAHAPALDALMGGCVSSMCFAECSFQRAAYCAQRECFP